MKFLKNQKGFSLIEGLLIVMTLALITVVGFYVYNSQKDKRESKSPESVQQAADTQNNDFIELKKLGLKLKKTDELSGVNFHETTSTGGLKAIANSSELLETYKTCLNNATQYNRADVEKALASADETYGPYVIKENGDFNNKYSDPDSVGVSLIKQYSGFYTLQEYGDGGVMGCYLSDETGNPKPDPDLKAKFNSLRDSVVRAFETAQPIE